MTWTSRLKENYQWNHTRREEIRRSRIPLKKELKQNYQLYLMKSEGQAVLGRQ